MTSYKSKFASRNEEIEKFKENWTKLENDLYQSFFRDHSEKNQSVFPYSYQFVLDELSFNSKWCKLSSIGTDGSIYDDYDNIFKEFKAFQGPNPRNIEKLTEHLIQFMDHITETAGAAKPVHFFFFLFFLNYFSKNETGNLDNSQLFTRFCPHAEKLTGCELYAPIPFFLEILKVHQYKRDAEYRDINKSSRRSLYSTKAKTAKASQFSKKLSESLNNKIAVKNYKIFQIVQYQWLEAVRGIVSEQLFQLFNLTAFIFLYKFFDNYEIKKQDYFEEEILPFLIYTSKYLALPQGIRIPAEGFDSCFAGQFLKFGAKKPNETKRTASATSAKSKASESKPDEPSKQNVDYMNFLFEISSYLIKTGKCAESVYESIKSEQSKRDLFRTSLQNCMLNLVVTGNDPEHELPMVAFRLLYKFTKYLTVESQMNDLLQFSFDTRTSGIIASDEKEKYYIALIYYVDAFLWKPQYSVYAARILYRLSLKYTKLVKDYFDALFGERFNDVLALFDGSSTDSRVITAFIDTAIAFVKWYFSFSRNETKELPLFVEYIVFEYLPSAINRQYDSPKSQWKILQKLVELASRLLKSNDKYLIMMHENQKFISSIMPLASHISKTIRTIFKNKKLTADSYSSIEYYLGFEYRLFDFINNLLAFHIRQNGKPTYLYYSLFNDQWASDFISALIRLLNVEYCGNAVFQTFLSAIRAYALNIIEMMCTVGARIGNTSFEAYYDEKCQKILEAVIKNTLFEAKQSNNEVIRILDFLSSTIETQMTFAYSFIRELGLPFIITSLNYFEQFIQTEQKDSGDWKVYASLAQLVVKLLINLSSQSHVVNQILAPEKHKIETVTPQQDKKEADANEPGQEKDNQQPAQNPVTSPNTKKNPTANPTAKNNPTAKRKAGDHNEEIKCEGLSQKWEAIFRFIFQDNNSDDDPSDAYSYKLLTKSRFLNALVCIFLCNQHLRPEIDKEYILRFYDTLFEFEYDYINKQELPILRYNSKNYPNLNYNSLRNWSFYPTPEEFYLDLSLSEECLDGDTNWTDLRDAILHLNRRLFLIDSKTCVILSIHSLINYFVANSKPDLYDPTETRLITLLYHTLQVPLIPKSTIDLVFHLYLKCLDAPKSTRTLQLSNDKPSGKAFVNTFKSFLCSAVGYLEKNPNSSIFDAITKMLQMIEGTIPDDIRSLLLKLFNISSFIVAENPKEENAAKLLTEISSLVVFDTPTRTVQSLDISGINSLLYVNLLRNCISAPVAIHILQTTRILCSSQEFVHNLSKDGLFDFLTLVSSDHSIFPMNSPLWPNLYLIFRSLPSDSIHTFTFISKTFSYITFFLDDTSSISDNELAMSRTQEAIMSLVVHISPSMDKFKVFNPSTAQALTCLIYTQLFKSFNVVKRLVNQENLKNSESLRNLVDLDSHNLLTANFLTVYYCISSIVCMIEYPNGAIPFGFQKEETIRKLYCFSVDMIEPFDDMLRKLRSNEHRNKDSRLDFDAIFMRCFEMACQIFAAIVINDTKDEKQQYKEDFSKIEENLNEYFPPKSKSNDFLNHLKAMINGHLNPNTDE